MALYTTNPTEELYMYESAASRIPTADMVEPVHGAVNVTPDASISIDLEQGALTLPVVRVNGAVVFEDNEPKLGWRAASRALGEFRILVLTPPSGFRYGTTYTVTVDLVPEAGANDDGYVPGG
jgi:hypothetical protein